VAAEVSERPVGGLGIFLVRQLMDSVSYERVATRNRLMMSKRVSGVGC
jgi:serine/threonine-protein kinase RsbW